MVVGFVVRTHLLYNVPVNIVDRTRYAITCDF